MLVDYTKIYSEAKKLGIKPGTKAYREFAAGMLTLELFTTNKNPFKPNAPQNYLQGKMGGKRTFSKNGYKNFFYINSGSYSIALDAGKWKTKCIEFEDLVDTVQGLKTDAEDLQFAHYRNRKQYYRALADGPFQVHVVAIISSTDPTDGTLSEERTIEEILDAANTGTFEYIPLGDTYSQIDHSAALHVATLDLDMTSMFKEATRIVDNPSQAAREMSIYTLLSQNADANATSYIEHTWKSWRLMPKKVRRG